MPGPGRPDLSRRCLPLAEPYYLGIDLGTSSIKGILRTESGKTVKAKRVYTGQTPQAWCQAMEELLSVLAHDRTVAAVAFSSQVGTYLVDDTHVISWQSSAGKEELADIRKSISPDTFVREISMPHPELVSYPLPRLLYIQKHFGSDCQVLMPKDYLIRELTGQTVTDLYSARGVANLHTGRYATALLEQLGIKIRLPMLKRPTELAGYVTEGAAARFHLPAGTPVYLGCNDFFAGLLGMGVCQIGDSFDLTGTSEHIGFLSQDIQPQGFVSGKYFVGNCTYGGTKASGSSCDFAMRTFGVERLSVENLLPAKPPIFLPYLCGERAPVYDEKAQGTYMGIRADTSADMLAYSALEGVAFSLYHIAQSMSFPQPKQLICGGGAAKSTLLNTIKATLFNCPVVTATENDTSALGACMLAMVGDGCYDCVEEAVRHCVSYAEPVRPLPQYRAALLERFSVYRELYPALKQSFHHFYRISERNLL